MKQKFQKIKCCVLTILVALSISFSATNSSGMVNNGTKFEICSDESREVTLPADPTPPERY